MHRVDSSQQTLCSDPFVRQSSKGASQGLPEGPLEGPPEYPLKDPPGPSRGCSNDAPAGPVHLLKEATRQGWETARLVELMSEKEF